MTAGDGTVDASIQDSTSPLFQYFLMNELKTDITLTSNVSEDDEVINVSTGHGFTAASGEHILLLQNNRYLQARVISVAVDAITIAEPSTTDFTVAGAAVVRGNINMNVDGSVTPVDFKTNLTNFTIPIDISKAIFTMQHGANVPDDGKFGGIAALTNGLFFRKTDGSTFPLGNYTMNQDFKDMGGNVEYTDKAPAGTNATDIVFDIKNIFGQVVRLSPAGNDMILGQIRDNVDSGEGMVKFTVSLVGSYTVGEQ